MWESGETQYSTTLSSLQRDHRSTHFHALYSAFASVVGLLCIAVIILISIWRYHQQRMLLNAVARRHGDRRLISTYPEMRGVATVTLPPPYCDAVDAPPPYSSVDRTMTSVSANFQSHVVCVGSDAVPDRSLQPPTYEFDHLLNPQT